MRKGKVGGFKRNLSSGKKEGRLFYWGKRRERRGVLNEKKGGGGQSCAIMNQGKGKPAHAD